MARAIKTMQTIQDKLPPKAPAPKPAGLQILILGLSITSSWGNGHATTYRGLVRELVKRGHEVLFLEHDKPWYAANRDMPHPPYGRTGLYQSVEDLKDRFSRDVEGADLVIVGSYVPEGVAVGSWVTTAAPGVTAFYDIDTPVTLDKLARGDFEYVTPELISRYDLYLSFAGGPTLDLLERKYGSPRARPLYCSVDPELYYPEQRRSEQAKSAISNRQSEIPWDLGYLGTYSDDRQPPLERLMLDAARAWPEGRFVVAGPQYPDSVQWPTNLERIFHLPPAEHRRFYNRQRFTMNITRAAMIQAGYSPSVRLFEAAACGVPIISDWWQGLDTFFKPETEILISRCADDTLRYLRDLSETRRRSIGQAAREKVLTAHTAAHRAAELEAYAMELMRS